MLCSLLVTFLVISVFLGITSQLLYFFVCFVGFEEVSIKVGVYAICNIWGFFVKFKEVLKKVKVYRIFKSL
jgi:hypothetical protein